MNYSYNHYKLHNDPLSFVLCQIKFSKVRRMPDFIPHIHDLLRKEGFPEDVSATVQQVVITPGNQPQITTRKQDEFRSKDNQWASQSVRICWYWLQLAMIGLMDLQIDSKNVLKSLTRWLKFTTA